MSIEQRVIVIFRKIFITFVKGGFFVYLGLVLKHYIHVYNYRKIYKVGFKLIKL